MPPETSRLGAEPSPHRHFYPRIHAKYLKKNTSGISFEIPKQLNWEIVVEPPKEIASQKGLRRPLASTLQPARSSLAPFERRSR